MNLGIEIVVYVCEYTMQLLCIHSFLGKNVKFDLKLLVTGSTFISILLAVLHMNLPNIFTLLSHVVMFIYILIEFGIKIVDDIVLILFNILVSGSLQLLAALPVSLMSNSINNDGIVVLIINLVSVFIMAFIYKRMKVNKIYIKIIEFDKIIAKALVIIFVLFIYLFIAYKVKEEMEVLAYFITGILVFLVVAVIHNWQKDRFEIKQKNLELYMHELYGKTFEGMVENIRIRQHDFKNQLAAIYGMHLTADSFEELVESQKKYCDYIIEESRYDSILTKCNDKILAGFLYTKFTEWEKKGVQFDFEIVLSNSKCKLATYELIEITGTLLDNASEHEINCEVHKPVQFTIKENEKAVIIICRNHTNYMPSDEIGKLFDKGYSTKGDGRGLGLYNVKKLLDGKGSIIAGNQMIEGENYLEFKIEISR